jgi:flagellar biosynthesis chaperone FliJ
MTSTAVTTKTGEIDKAAIAKLRSCVGELERGVEKLGKSLVECRGRREKLIAERGSLVLLARSGKDKAAQDRLYAIDEQLTPLKQNIADDESALAELTDQLESAQNNLFAAEWEARRSQLRERLIARLNSGVSEALEKATETLLTQMEAAIEEDRRIESLVVAFEPRLHGPASELRKLRRVRAELLGWRLRDVLPIDTRGQNVQAMQGREIATSDQRFYGGVLESLDRLELVL